MLGGRWAESTVLLKKHIPLPLSFLSPRRSPLVIKLRSTPSFSSALSFPWQLLWWGAQDSALREAEKRKHTNFVSVVPQVKSHNQVWVICSALSSSISSLIFADCSFSSSIFLSISIFFPLLLTLQLESYLSNIHTWLAPCISFSCSACLLEMLKRSTEQLLPQNSLHASCVQCEHS